MEDRVFAARVDERQRLGGELHDGLGQTLFSAGLQIAALKRMLPHDGEAAAVVDELSTSLQQAQADVRTLSFALQPPWIAEPNGFERALREFVEGFTRRAGISQDVEFVGSPVSISPAAQLALFRTLQEALVNVHRHAQASGVRVRLVWTGGAISLSIQDNGAGMAGSGSAHHRGVGVSSMRTRMRQLGGDLDVVGGPGGTTLAATLPVKRNLFGQTVTLELLYQRLHAFIYVLTGPELRFAFANPAFLRMIGEDDVLGRRFVDVLPSLAQEFLKITAQIRESREAFVASSVPQGVTRAGVSRTVFVDIVAQPIFADDGDLYAIFVEGYDVTAKVAADQRLRLFAQELEHRINNLLSFIQGIVRLSDGQNAASLKKNILGRIAAFGNAHRLLSRSRWSGAVLQQLVEEEMLPYAFGDPARVQLSGPTINLGPEEAQALAMALHELATNAAKYGALSTRSGRVEVTWEQDPTGVRRIHWREHGGPVVETPTRKGFGASVLERALRNVGGRTRQLWRSEGLACVFELPPSQAGCQPQ
jgi:signal transduction histidine kinase